MLGPYQVPLNTSNQLLEKNTTRIRSYHTKVNSRRNNNGENAAIDQDEEPKLIPATSNPEMEALMVVRPVGAAGSRDKNIETLMMAES